MRSEYDFSSGKRGAVIASPGKTRITIMLDDDVLDHFRTEAEAQACGYQTMINATLRKAIGTGRDDSPVTAGALRRILREELRAN
jgi:uncharacterized protein (DUF4415 family)